MAKVKLTITESRCRDGLCRAGDAFIVEGLCPPLCHELWSCIYPQVFALLNGAELDYGNARAACFDAACPDGGRVKVHAQLLEDRKGGTDMDRLQGKISASLLGGALGDALGYAVEFSSWPAIQARFGKNGIRQLSLLDGKARFSDDTQMTLFTAEGLCLAAERGDDPLWGVYNAYLCWLRTQGGDAETPYAALSALLPLPEMNQLRAPGNTCLNALRSGIMGTTERPVNHSKGCGGVMRTAPCGLVRRGGKRGKPLGDPIALGAGAAAITHGHALGWIPAAMLADLADRCLYESYESLRQLTEDSLAATVRAFVHREEVGPFEALIRRAMELSERPVESERETAAVDEPAIRSLGGGWVGEEALAIALYAALRYERDLKAALIAAVNHGGDSDSTGAICGNILGAWLGPDAIPADWAEELELRAEIEAAAQRLYALTL